MSDGDNPQERPPHPLLAVARRFTKVLLAISALLSAGVVVAGAAIYVVDRYRDRYQWRDAEYAKLRSLHAGYTLERFEAVLGTPVFSRTHSRSKLREDSFRRRHYWVQAVSQEDGTVLLYSVTACDPAFQPDFDISGYRGRTGDGEDRRDNVRRGPPATG